MSQPRDHAVTCQVCFSRTTLNHDAICHDCRPDETCSICKVNRWTLDRSEASQAVMLCDECEETCPRCGEVAVLEASPCGRICQPCYNEIDELDGDDDYARNYWHSEGIDQMLHLAGL